jgi:hypothetical protein
MSDQTNKIDRLNKLAIWASIFLASIYDHPNDMAPAEINCVSKENGAIQRWATSDLKQESHFGDYSLDDLWERHVQPAVAAIKNGLPPGMKFGELEIPPGTDCARSTHAGVSVRLCQREGFRRMFDESGVEINYEMISSIRIDVLVVPT